MSAAVVEIKQEWPARQGHECRESRSGILPESHEEVGSGSASDLTIFSCQLATYTPEAKSLS